MIEISPVFLCMKLFCHGPGISEEMSSLLIQRLATLFNFTRLIVSSSGNIADKEHKYLVHHDIIHSTRTYSFSICHHVSFIEYLSAYFIHICFSYYI